MNAVLLVGIGGFVGSVCRYGVNALTQQYYPLAVFPWATLTVNVVGALLVGVVAHGLESVSAGGVELRLMLVTGFLGGFTTFSAFSLESAALIRQGLVGPMMVNVMANVVLSIAAVFLGLLLGRSLF